MLITPNSEIRVESCVDILVDCESKIVGSSYPMMSVPRKALEGAGRVVARKLVERGVVGYVSLNFTAYKVEGGAEGEGNKNLRMIGTSIEPQLTAAACTYRFAKFICGEGAMLGSALSKSYSCLDHMYNPSLGSVQYGSFFKLCRMQAISYDLETMTGLVFLLVDNLSSGVMGLVAVGENTQESLAKIVEGLNFIKSNVGTPAAYNEVNLKDEGWEGSMVEFVRLLKSAEDEAKKASVLHNKLKMKKLMKAAL